MTFFKYMMRYLGKNTPAGDLARDMDMDMDKFPVEDDGKVIMNYLFSQGASSGCIDTFIRGGRRLRSKEFEGMMKCPICMGEAKIEEWHTRSGRKLTRIGCETKVCPNNIKNSPVHTTKPQALKSWNARKWDGHNHRRAEPETATLALFCEEAES